MRGKEISVNQGWTAGNSGGKGKQMIEGKAWRAAPETMIDGREKELENAVFNNSFPWR